MRLANRVASLPPYLFAEVSKKIAQRRAAGHDVISLGIGDPDLPTPPHIVEAMAQFVHDPADAPLPRVRRAFPSSGRPWPSGTIAGSA